MMEECAKYVLLEESQGGERRNAQGRKVALLECNAAAVRLSSPKILKIDANRKATLWLRARRPVEK
jgi:hypothetical protein